MGRQAKSGEFRTFSVGFEDAEFDETSYQRMMARTLESSHEELLVTKRDIARVFPEVIWHTERPILRTAPAPLFLLSQRVREAGIKTVLTGEGADEMLGGYDIFREAKIRQFWASVPDSKVRPLLFDRIYPYLARSPLKAKRMAMEFWKQGLDRAGQPGFSHDPRWSTTTMLKKFYAPALRSALDSRPAPDFLTTLPPRFGTWGSLAQAQYIEIETLFAGYIISSQGDRMLMAHSVEGRFPFLDADVMEFSNSLPEDHKLPGLSEKQILKVLAKGIVPDPIIERSKQPYRAPDAVCFVTADAPEYAAELLSLERITEAGLFDPKAVQRLYEKCRSQMRKGTLIGNTDNMALIGILSSQILYDKFVRSGADGWQTIELTTLVDRVHKEPKTVTEERR
jgi:asparagine synthase (glutamine-hydrolysing)